MKRFLLILFPILATALVHAQQPASPATAPLTAVEKADRQFLENIQQHEATQPSPAPVAPVPEPKVPSPAPKVNASEEPALARPAPVAAQPEPVTAHSKAKPQRSKSTTPQASKKVARHQSEARSDRTSQARRAIEVPVPGVNAVVYPPAIAAQVERKLRSVKRAIELPALPPRWVKVTTVTTRTERGHDRDDDDDHDEDDGDRD